MNLLHVQNRIIELLSRWVASIKGSTKLSRTDLNHVSENILVPLLREVYGLSDLRNLNLESANYPSIDLADDNARVAIQVTSTATSNKIRHTLVEFVNHRLYEKYDHLIVYILIEKQKSYRGKDFDDIIQGRFKFDIKDDIQDYRDLLEIINNFQIDRAKRILDILEANFQYEVQQQNIKISEFKVIRWFPLMVLLIFFVALLLFYLFGQQPTQPERMTGLFNVAVSEMIVLDVSGNPIKGKDGIAVANYIADTIQLKFNDLELNKIVKTEIWGPELTPRIMGTSPEMRLQNAKDLADHIGAHIVIYGVLIDNGQDSYFSPEFYINHNGFVEAEEITGQYELGRSIHVVLPFDSMIQPIENLTLKARVDVLTLITLGLVHYSVDNYLSALDYFQQAIEHPDWIAPAGQEVAYLLIGNANIRQWNRDQNMNWLISAGQAYSQSTGIQPDFGRALIGQANVNILLASGDPPCAAPNQTLLERAESLLKLATSTQHQQTGANIEIKVQFYHAMIDLCRFRAGMTGQDWAQEASIGFQSVIDNYNNENQNLRFMTSHAYASLGFINALLGKLEDAIDNLNHAIELASPYYKGVYASWMGDFYSNYQMYEKAANAYQLAINYAEQAIDRKGLKNYQDKLNSLPPH